MSWQWFLHTGSETEGLKTRFCSAEEFRISGCIIKLWFTERCAIFTFTGKKRVDPKIFRHSPLGRDQLMHALLKKGIATRRITAIHLEPFYRKLCGNISLPETERAFRWVILLPMYSSIENKQLNHVIKTLTELLK